MLRRVCFAVAFFASVSIGAQELDPLGNGFYSARCSTQEEIDGLAQTDSIQSLLLDCGYKNLKPAGEIRLKSPEYLEQLTIWCRRVDDIRFKDSLVNLRSLSVEGLFRDSLLLKFNPGKIRYLGIAFKRSNFNYLGRFVNVDTLAVQYVGGDRKMFSVLRKLPQIGYLDLTKQRGEITLDTSLHVVRLHTLSGNFSFTDHNVLLLLQHPSLQKLAFVGVRYRYFPPLLPRLCKEKKVYVRSLKGIKNAELYHLQAEGAHLVHLGGRMWE